MATSLTLTEVLRMLTVLTLPQKIGLARLLLAHPAVKAALDGTESNKRTEAESEVTSNKKINELPDRGRDNQTKTVADPHGKPVQE